MKENILAGIVTGIFIFGMTSTVQAELIMHDSNTFFKDTTTGWYWYTDVAEFTNTTWGDAKAEISSLDTGSDMIWEMATASDVEDLFSNRDLPVAEMFFETGEYYSDYTTNDGVFTMGWVDSLGSYNNYTSNALGIYYYQTVKLGHDPEYIYTLTTGSQGQTYTVDLGAYAVFKADSTFLFPAAQSTDPVPEPSTLFLLGVGVMGFVSSKFKVKGKA